MTKPDLNIYPGTLPYAEEDTGRRILESFRGKGWHDHADAARAELEKAAQKARDRYEIGELIPTPEPEW